jgi:hypothetical protein
MADSDDDGFITLPPGIFDASTLKAMPKPERPRTDRDDIVFVPVAPGMPVPPVDEQAPEVIAAPVAPPAAPSAPAQQVTPPAPAAPASATAAWTLVLADGSEVPVRGVLLLGRNPAPFATWPQAQLLAVTDTTQSVSKTHVAFEVDDSGLWVHDLNSTNGVWVVNGSDVTEVAPGRRVNVPAGASIELGDYVLTVRR